jgi:hypothetical protein
VGQANLALAAMGARADVLVDCGEDQICAHQANGVGWYHSRDQSWGFAPAGATVFRNTCDYGGDSPHLRMCWHTTTGRITTGYRCGSNELNDSAAWERVIYQTAGAAQPEARAGDLRLVGGANAREGRVEIYWDGQWGTVCDDLWTNDLDQAHVVCRQLGLGRATQATRESSFGQGAGPIWMDNVVCTGNEARLADCGHNGWGVHNCNHGTDAGVVCSAP